MLHILWKAVSTHFTTMTNSRSVALHILWIVVSSHPFLWPTASEWHCTFCERQSHHIFSYDQQEVSDIAHLVKYSLVTSFPTTTASEFAHLWKVAHHIFYMTNSKWVALHIFWTVVPSHVFLWSTASEWHWILWKTVSSHLFICPTGSKWHCTFCETQSYHIFSYDQQGVSDIAHFVTGSLIMSSPMTNREWVTFHILWKIVSSPLFLWPKACKWHCTFCERESHHIISYYIWQKACEWHWKFYERQGSLITSAIPMTNRMWVTLHIVWKAVSSHIFLLPTASEWHCTFCERQFHHILSYDQQFVGDIAHFV